jgi:biotin operon repressor
MAGAIEELFSILKIVPDENNIKNISEHLEDFNALIHNFTEDLKELAMQHLVSDSGTAADNLRKAGINIDSLKQKLPSVEKNIGRAEENAEGFKTEMKGAGKNIDEALKNSQMMTNSLQALNIVGGFFTGIVKGWVSEMKNFIGESIRASSEAQKIKLSLQGVFGDDKMADDFIEQLKTMEKASGYSKETLAGVAQQLLPTFENPEQAMAMLNDIQRLSLGNQANLGGIADAFVQIGNSAQISQKELKMFRNATGGMNIGKQLEKDLGKSKEEIDAMLKKGLISKNQLADAIHNISAGLKSKPEEIGNTFDAVFKRVKENIQQNLGDALIPLANAMKPLIEKMETLDFEGIAKKVEPFAAAIAAASPMIFNLVDAMLNFAEVLMTIATPFAQLLGWMLNFIAKTPGLNAAFIGLIGLLGAKGLTYVIRFLIQRLRDMSAQFIALSGNAGVAGAAIADAGVSIANAGGAAQTAAGQIANTGRATNALNIQAAASPAAMTRMVGGLRKVAFGVRGLGRTIKSTLVGIGPAGWAMLGIGAASEIYAHFQNKKEEDGLKDFDMTLPKDQKLPEWQFNMNNKIDNQFSLDREGKSNMSREMLETAIKEQTRSIFNMEIMRILEVSEQGGAVSV